MFFFLSLDQTQSYLLSLFQYRTVPPLLALGTLHHLPTSCSKLCSSDVRAHAGDGSGGAVGGGVKPHRSLSHTARPGASASPGRAGTGCYLPIHLLSDSLPAPREQSWYSRTCFAFSISFLERSKQVETLTNKFRDRIPLSF